MQPIYTHSTKKSILSNKKYKLVKKIVEICRNMSKHVERARKL